MSSRSSPLNLRGSRYRGLSGNVYSIRTSFHHCCCCCCRSLSDWVYRKKKETRCLCPQCHWSCHVQPKTEIESWSGRSGFFSNHVLRFLFFFFSLPFIWKLTTACATVLDQILFKRVVGFFFLHGTSVACSIVPENRQLTQRPHDHDVCLLPPPLATSEINVTFSFLCSLSQLREHVFVGRQFCQETRVNYSFPGATKRFQVDLRQSPYSIVYILNILSALPLPHVSTLLFLRKRGI